LVTRVERHIIRHPSKPLKEICHKAKNLYNYVNYHIRQKFFAGESIPSDIELINTLTAENQADYRALPAQTAQQVIRLLSENWKSFFKANADYKENPHKYLGKPQIPKYKKKDGFSILQQSQGETSVVHRGPGIFQPNPSSDPKTKPKDR